jgi:hypothetical protein
MTEPDLTHCETGDLSSAQPNRGHNCLFPPRPPFGTPANRNKLFRPRFDSNAICEHCELPELVRDWLQGETQEVATGRQIKTALSANANRD